MDRTERFRGRLLAGDRLLSESVEGLLKTHQRTNAHVSEWTGYFDVPAHLPEPLVEGNRYRIVLIDGRAGSISVHVSHDGESNRPRAHFHGTGSARR